MSYLDQQVSLDYYYPNYGTPVMTAQVATVSPLSTEFLDIQRFDNDPRDAHTIVNADIDITSTRIQYKADETRFRNYRDFAFDGISIRGLSAAFPAIRGYGVDQAYSSPDLRPGQVTFDDRTISVNFATTDVYAGQFAINVIFQNGSAIDGFATSDFIFGSGIGESIVAREGNDTVLGAGGDDLIFGNLGDDSLFGNLGLDTIYAGQGTDTVFGGQQDDLIFGNFGNDIVLGNIGTDSLFGGQGLDTLYGGQGDDFLSGDLGGDVLSGDLGADRYAFGLNSGPDLILGFSQAGGDRLLLNGQTYTVGTTTTGNALLTLSGGGTIELAGVRAAEVNAAFFA
ncbi:calcium-binding protein [Methylobacterium sp. A54F]